MGNWWKKVNFGNGVAEILTKCMREKSLNFSNLITEILAARNWLKGNQLWQPSCRNYRGVRREKIGIVATKLLKMGEKKERENCGNQVAENLVHKWYYICIKMESCMSKIIWSIINKHTMPKKKKKITSLHNKQKVTSPENYQIFVVDTRQKKLPENYFPTVHTLSSITRQKNSENI